MTARKTVLGVMALCALAFTAISASSASAAGTTLFTCIKVAPNAGNFVDADCENTSPGSKDWTHQEFAAATPTQLTATAVGNQVLTGTLAGAASELEATGVEATAGSVQNNAGPPMDVSGTVTLKYTGVTVKKPLNCKVPGGSVTTEPLKYTSIIGEGAKNTGLKFEPVTGEVFATLNFENNGGTCAIAGTPFTVKGKVTGNPKGATLSVSAASEELTLGPKPATLTGTVTISGRDVAAGDVSCKPLSVTTTAS